MERKHTPVYGIKGKLISAVCMLLVAVIMVVSSTYAWFTLSTAPEVTGISTAIGANGALEIRLDGKNTDGTDSTEVNATWGNLVDLATGYGVDQIKLLPSTLKAGSTAGTFDAASPLLRPTYGADGRPEFVDGQPDGATVTGIYADNKFSANSGTGLRAVGVASGMTDRQLAYRNAKSAVADAMSAAQNAASTSLNANGNTLADIVIKKALDSNGTAKYTQAELTALEAIVDDLLGKDSTKADGVLEFIKQAYLNQIVALAASDASNQIKGEGDANRDTALGDIIYSTVKSQVDAGTLSIDSITTGTNQGKIVVNVKANADDTTGTDYTFDISTSALYTGMVKYNEMETKVNNAKTAIDTLQTANSDEMSWEQISGVLQYLIVVDNVTVNNMTATQISGDINAFVNTVLRGGNGITISMNPGAGVYVDVADHCGNYNANVNITKVEYGGMILTDLPVLMTTSSNVNPAYLTAANTFALAKGEPANAGTGAQVLPMSEFYGYIIDLAFRTNAASSDLLLQVAAKDRIYSDNQNEATMGGGSSMTFKSTSADFTNEQVKNLMSSIRIVFFTPGSVNTILAYAKLDVANAKITSNGVKADMYLYEEATGVSFTYKDANEKEVTEIYQVVTVVTYTNQGAIVDASKVTEREGKYYYKADENTAEVEVNKVETPSYYLVTNGNVAKDPSTTLTNNTAFDAAGVTRKDNVPFDKKLTDKNAVITSLPQNQEVKVSTLVYLEGDPNKGGVENDDVSAIGTTSVTGSMNIQFGSSAELTPMEYGDLHITDKFAVTNTLPEGVTSTGETTAAKGQAYTFGLEGTDAGKTYTVKYKVGTEGTEKTLTVSNGTYTIPAAEVTDKIFITVTANS